MSWWDRFNQQWRMVFRKLKPTTTGYYYYERQLLKQIEPNFKLEEFGSVKKIPAG